MGDSLVSIIICGLSLTKHRIDSAFRYAALANKQPLFGRLSHPVAFCDRGWRQEIRNCRPSATLANLFRRASARTEAQLTSHA
jgi:hypothetical protein